MLCIFFSFSIVFTNRAEQQPLQAFTAESTIDPQLLIVLKAALEEFIKIQQQEGTIAPSQPVAVQQPQQTNTAAEPLQANASNNQLPPALVKALGSQEAAHQFDIGAKQIGDHLHMEKKSLYKRIWHFIKQHYVATPLVVTTLAILMYDWYCGGFSNSGATFKWLGSKTLAWCVPQSWLAANVQKPSAHTTPQPQPQPTMDKQKPTPMPSTSTAQPAATPPMPPVQPTVVVPPQATTNPQNPFAKNDTPSTQPQTQTIYNQPAGFANFTQNAEPPLPETFSWNWDNAKNTVETNSWLFTPLVILVGTWRVLTR